MLQVSYSVKDYPNAEYPCTIVYEDRVMHDGVSIAHSQKCVCYWHQSDEKTAKADANRIAYLLNLELNKGM